MSNFGISIDDKLAQEYPCFYLACVFDVKKTSGKYVGVQVANQVENAWAQFAYKAYQLTKDKNTFYCLKFNGSTYHTSVAGVVRPGFYNRSDFISAPSSKYNHNTGEYTYEFTPFWDFKIYIYVELTRDDIANGYGLEVKNSNGEPVYFAASSDLAFSYARDFKIGNLPQEDRLYLSDYYKISGYTHHFTATSNTGKLVYASDVDNHTEPCYVTNEPIILSIKPPTVADEQKLNALGRYFTLR